MLVAENISKSFSGVTVLDKVSLELPAGKVTAIIGENGAGKSTLMKILSGVYFDYDGQIVYKNRPVRFQNTKEAQSAGIAIIQQELSLVPYLSITENIFLGRELTTSWAMLDKKNMHKIVVDLLKKLHLDVDPNSTISSLKVGQQQVVEIAKALLLDATLMIMDEPTSAISEKEVAVLFGIIEQLKKENKAIAYISHKLDELFRIADHYVILRDGRLIETGNMKSISHDAIVQKMVGREINAARKTDTKDNRPALMSVENICLTQAERYKGLLLKNISFDLRQGEILGIFGLMGAGRTELMETIFGLHSKRASGNIRISEKSIRPHSPSEAIAAGLALVPEDRKKDGLVLGLDVRTNICLTTLGKLQSLGFLNKRKEAALAKKYTADLRIKSSSDKQLAKNLSGGNQQKIVLGKWLATDPKILLLDEPTRGIDIHAKNEIYKLILDLANEGLAVILVSSELPEILALSDRILVMAEGAVTAEFPGRDATEENILNAAIPKTI